MKQLEILDLQNAQSAEKHRPVKWICENLNFPPQSGRLLAGQKVGKHILPFQKQIIKACLDKDGYARKNCFIGWTRKISKSMLFGWILIYLLETTARQGILMSSTYGQADNLFRSVLNSIQFSPFIKGNYKIRKDYIINKKTTARLQKIFNSSESNLGMQDLSFAVIDELSALPDRKNMDVIISGMSLGPEKPLILYTSNPPASSDHWSVPFVSALDKSKDTDTFHYQADSTEKINSESAWSQANPFIEHYLKTKDKIYRAPYEFYQNEVVKAVSDKESELSFRRFLLGQKIEVSGFRFCDSSDIGIAKNPEKIFKDKSLRTALSWDLSFSKDFSACALVFFSEETGKLFIKPWLFLANLSGRFPSQKNLLQSWATAGYLRLYKEKSMPTEKAINEVKSFLKEHSINPEFITSDYALFRQWKLDIAWPNTMPVYMSPRAMAGPIRFLQGKIKSKQVSFTEKNPCATWHFSNALVSEKSTGFCTLFRSSSHASIDLADATTLGIKMITENPRKKFAGFVT